MSGEPLRPDSPEALIDAIREHAARAEPVAIRGGGTRQGLGAPVIGTRLELDALSGVTLYEPGALTLVARAGTPLDEIEALLAGEGQLLPFEPMRLGPLLGNGGTSTLGGVVATNASGPRRIQSGACRDSLIGVEFVDGQGEAIKNGGRVMKNVTGYDLVKLMCGTHGTLGVLSSVSFKLLPAPEHAITLSIEGLDVAAAVGAMSAALGSPYNVSGAAHGSLADDEAPCTRIRLDGLTGSVEYRSGKLQAELAAFGDVGIDEQADSVLACWAAIRDVQAFASRPDEPAGTQDDVWRISVRPSDGVRVDERLRPGGASLQFDWGGGLAWARVPGGTDVRAALQGIPGHATLMRAGENTQETLGVFAPEPAPVAAVSAGLRARFDPQAILNRGRMGVTAKAAA